jgi:hypothetical protein
MADQIASSIALASRCTMQADLLYHRQLALIEDLAKTGVPTDAAQKIASLMQEHRDQCHEWLKSLIRRCESTSSTCEPADDHAARPHRFPAGNEAGLPPQAELCTTHTHYMVLPEKLGDPRMTARGDLFCSPRGRALRYGCHETREPQALTTVGRATQTRTS